MKTILKTCLCASIVYMSASLAEQASAPTNKHVSIGAGMVTSNLPVSIAKLKIPILNVNYDYSFMNPMEQFRTSIEVGLYGLYALLPVPQFGANVYLGSEDRDFQLKFGTSAFYDISVGGHAGLMVKPGVVIGNRVDVSLVVVPVGTDSKRSYARFFGLESSEKSEQKYIQNGNRHVILPYYGLLISYRI